MDLQLKDKVIIVTGGAKGIGAAIVRACAAEGAVPVIVGRDASAGAELKKEIERGGGRCGIITVELASAESCERSVSETVKQWGRLDGLVNNAGAHEAKRTAELSLSEFESSMRLNASSVLIACREAYPHLRKSGEGLIINIGSFFDKLGVKRNLAYCASKAAVGHMTRVLARKDP